MARQSGEFIENQFTKGLITEATGLNFPEKAFIDGWNVRVDRIGEVTRRLGLDNESATVTTSAAVGPGCRSGFVWRNVANRDLDLYVLQAGQRIRFFGIAADGLLTPQSKSFTINLLTYAVNATATDIAQLPCHFAAARGHLFIVHPLCEPVWVEYSNNDITVTQYEIHARDMQGVNDHYAVDERRETITARHKYNLYNQGWYHQKGEVALEDVPDVSTTVLDYYRSFHGEYPSNAEVWWQYKSIDDEFEPNQRAKFPVTTTAAAKGHYIYNAFNIDREEASGIDNLPGYQTDKRPSTIAFYAGRVWYAGVGDKIYYTQLVEDDSQYGLCYQKNDPTDENYSDLLDTDGGVIQILGLGEATGLFATGNNIIVFATNGIWAIGGSGAEGTGFVATDFTVQRMSTTSLLSIDSLLDVEGSPIWWNLEGIWAMQENKVVSLSQDTIQSWLDDYVPVGHRPYVQGAYNPSTRTVQWLFKTAQAATNTEMYQYDGLLEFDITSGAFYPHRWDDSHYLSTIVCLTQISEETYNEDIVEDSVGDPVVDSSSDDVTINDISLVEFSAAKFKYLKVTGSNFSVLEEKDADFVDFEVLEGTGINYDSYLVTGASLFNKGKIGTLEYVEVFCRTVDEQSLNLQGRWDWANAAAANKWSTTQQCYTVQRDNRDVSRKRLLVRGSGPAVQLKFSSVAGKPFRLIGWTLWMTIDALP